MHLHPKIPISPILSSRLCVLGIDIQGELIAELDCDNSFHAKDKPPGFLVGYTDASFGGDPGRKSRTGCVVIARGAAVDWLSKKQSMVALSSTEAEYLSLSQMTQMMAGLRYTLTDLGEEETVKKPSRIYEDNKSCIAIAYQPMHQGRTKHFDSQAASETQAVCGTLSSQYSSNYQAQ